ncbi:MAG: electron transfer flavoprotein subunit beta/FixA family protein [Ichthyobacteriaceae bacterium]|nr:electron transfer flavoprotein subunit beta/FixA family protein [Ichthyobacteriaceae bacterium]
MKILVCIGHVPDTTSKIKFTNNDTEFDATGIQYVINPHDEFTLAKAMQLKEKQSAKLVVVNVGLVSTEPTLRKALAIGADSAIRVNLDPKDSLTVASEIAKVALDGGFDLIMAGKESIDYNGGMVPGLLASINNMPFVNAVVGLDIDGAKATVIREIDGGKETLSANLPLVIAGQKGLVTEEELRIPNMRGIMMARKKPLSVVEPSATETMLEFTKFEKPEAKAECKMVSADNVEELVDLLHNEAKAL